MRDTICYNNIRDHIYKFQIKIKILWAGHVLCVLYCLVLCLQLCHECEMNLMLGLARLFTRSSASVEQGQVQCGWHSVKFVNIHYNLRLMTFKAGLNQHYPNARQFWWAFECATICQRGKGIQVCWE